MTLLSTVQTAAKELGLPTPSTVYGNADATAKQLLVLLEREGKERRDMWRWPMLNREFTWTLATSTASYAFNTDVDYAVFRSHWDRSSQFELLGPVTEQEWQALKSGITSTGPRRRFRIKGVADKQIFIDPTPDSGDNGLTMVLEYQSLNWIRPKTWAASTVFAAGSYSFYNGNYYSTTLGGTTGSTAPTHTSSSVSDGSVSWTYYSGIYDTFTADTDICVLDEERLILGLKWRFRREKGLEWEAFKAEADESWKRSSASRKGARVLSLAGGKQSVLLGARNVPDTGYGD